MERLYPLRVETYSLRPDSGGAGRYRGGCGLVREIRLTEGEALLSLHSDRMKRAPYGLLGGGPGATAQWILNRGSANERVLSSKEAGIKLKAGDLLTIRTQGGGGYGEPGERDREAIERDLRAGKVSPKQCARATSGRMSWALKADRVLDVAASEEVRRD